MKKKLAFITEALPELLITELSRNEQGWDNDVLIVNKQLVFRFPKRKEVAAKIMAECMLLDLLKKTQPIALLPDYTPLYNGYGNFVCTYHPLIKGEPLSVNAITDETARILGNFLTKLHHLDSSLLNKAGIKQIHSLRYWRKLFQLIEKDVFPLLKDNEKQEVNMLFARYEETITENITHPIHGDLTKANILYHAETKQLGIIDFTDTQLGDPAFDFAGFFWDFGVEFTNKVLEHYNGPETAASIMKRVSSFYGLQPLLHEWLYKVRNNIDFSPQIGLEKMKRLQKGLP